MTPRSGNGRFLDRPGSRLQPALLSIAASLALAFPAKALQVWAQPLAGRPDPTALYQPLNAVFCGADKHIALQGARLSTVAFHLAIRPNVVAATHLDVSVSPLAGSAGTISASAVTLYREGMVDVPAISRLEGHPPLGSAGKVPDPLIPFTDPYPSGAGEIGVPFDVAAGSTQAVLVSVAIPAVEPGVYTGTLEVLDRDTPGTPVETLTLTLTVWRITMPVEPSLRALFVVDPSAITALYSPASQAERDALLDTHYAELTRRRIGPGYTYYREPLYDNASGFDWVSTGADAQNRDLLDVLHAPVFGVPSIWNYDTTSYRIQKPDGTPYQTADFTPGGDFDTQARRYYERLFDYLDTNGWRSKGIVFMEEDDQGQLCDEPYAVGKSAFDRVRAWADILHRPNPAMPSKRLPLMVATDSIVMSAPYADLRGACDIWDIYMDEVQLNADVYAARLGSHPDEQLMVVPNGYADFLDYPAVLHSIPGWFAYLYGATGIEEWGTMAWYDATGNFLDPWPAGNLGSLWGYGGGALFWPGKNLENRGIDIAGPVPSLRLEQLRASSLDYELLKALEAAGSKALAKELAQSVVPGTLYDGVMPSSDRIERCRTFALDWLNSGGGPVATVAGTVRNGSGNPVAGALVTDGTLSAKTDAAGTYNLTLPEGHVALNCNAPGMIDQAKVIDANGQVAGIDFNLSDVPTSSVRFHNSFESAADLFEDPVGCMVSLSNAHVKDGSFAMRVVYSQAAVDSSVATEVIVPGNFTPYDYLAMDVYNDSPYLTELEVALYDAGWAHYSYELFYLRPGEWNPLILPMNRVALDLDISTIVEMDLAVDAYQKADRTLFFDNFRLVKVTGGDTEAPGPPTDVSATVASDRVNLSWLPPTQDAGGGPLSGLFGYRIYRATNPSGPYSLLNANLEVTKPLFVDEGVTPSTSYYYKVSAIDRNGNESSRSGGCLTISPSVLPDPTLSVFYRQALTATGGTGPSTFSISQGALPPALSLSSGGLLSGMPQAPGTFAFTVSAMDGSGCAGAASYIMTVQGGGPAGDIVAGEGLGPPSPNRVRIFMPDGQPTPVDFLAYQAGAYGVNVAAGNAKNGSNDQVFTGPGPGYVFGPQVRGFGRDGKAMGKVNYYAYGTLRYGVNLALGGVDGDGFDELLTGAGGGEVFGPHLRGWDFDASSISPIPRINFFAYRTLKFGVKPASGDVDGDGLHEILSGPGPGALFGPQVRGWNFDGAKLSSINWINFYAFSASQYGVNLAGGDVDADAFDEIACSPGPGAGSAFPARFKGFATKGGGVTSLAGFDVTLPGGTSYGGRVALGEITGDAAADLLAGAGRDPAAPSTLRPYLYFSSSLTPLIAFDPFAYSRYGVNPAAGDFGY